MDATFSPFRHLAMLGFAGGGDGNGPDEIDISSEVLQELELAGKLVRGLLHHSRTSGLEPSLTQAGLQLMAAVGVDYAGVPSWRDPADATANLRQVMQLDAQGVSLLDEPLVNVLAELTGQTGALLRTLELARQAHSALENVVLHLAAHMPPADAATRKRLVAELDEALNAIGA